ncbi:MAG TPA: ATPase, partial [Sphingomonas sp.]
TLAGLSPLVSVSGSLILALAALEGAIDGEGLWAAAEVDEDWQADQWGRDPLAEAARDGRRRDLDAGLSFLAALRANGSGGG